jgi:lysophospholipase L1-like esterase
VIRSATLEVTYEAGKDYEWTAGSREVKLTKNSRIPFTTAAALHPAPKSPHSYSAFRDGKSWMLFGEGRYFHDLQCVASYPAKDEWKGPQPAPAPDIQLANVRKKLKASSPVKLVTLGDSISTGANASGSAGAPPMQPGYPDLVARGLEARFGSKVSAKNLSVGGMDSAWGLKQVPAVLAEAPDLVILAFGMNDASGRRKPADFSGIIKQTADQIHAARPECDIILVSPMTANPEWSHSAPDLYPAYAKVLAALAGPGCAMADVTAVWTAVLEKKPYLCLSGNGLNHPNDFGHRLYADVVLATVGNK